MNCLSKIQKREITRVVQVLGIPYEIVLELPTLLGMPIVLNASSNSTKKVFQQQKDWNRDLCSKKIVVSYGLKLFSPLLYSVFRVWFARYNWMRYSALFKRPETMSNSFVSKINQYVDTDS